MQYTYINTHNNNNTYNIGAPPMEVIHGGVSIFIKNDLIYNKIVKFYNIYVP